ncbi:RNA polymerase sigma factor [Pirellulaceae bacterium SH449]
MNHVFETPQDPGTTTLQQLKSFDNPAWKGIVSQYFMQIYGWCLESGIEAHAAADVTQNIFVSMLGSLHSFEKKDEGAFGGWVRRIAQRRIADFFRLKQPGAAASDLLRKVPSRSEVIQIVEDDTSQVGLEHISDERVLKIFLQAQMEFPESAWRAFWHVAVEGKSVAETAMELGTTKNTVYLSKSRIRKRLRELLDSIEFDS